MKRRNLFFLSYTIFLFICFFAKCFFDYPLWGAIVAAITTASCIFSCADIAEVVAVEYGKDVKDFEPLLESALEKCENLNKVFSMNEPTMESIRANDDEEASVLLEGPEVIEDVKDQLTKIQSGLKWKKRLSKLCSKISSPLIVFGNLSFFVQLLLSRLI